MKEMRKKGELVAIETIGFAPTAWENDAAAVRSALPLARSTCDSAQPYVNCRRIWQHAACNVPARVVVRLAMLCCMDAILSAISES